MEKTDAIDALAACVQAMRSEDVDEAEQAMLNELTNVIKKYKALRDFGDSTKSLHVHLRNGLSAAGGVDSTGKHAVSCPNVMKQPSLALNKVRQIDELASCAARRVRGAREARSADVDAVERAMLDQLTHVLRKYKTRRALSDSCKTLPVHHDDDPSAAGSFQLAANHRRFSDFSIKPPADLQHDRRASEPTLKFKAHTLPAYAWLNGIDTFQDPAAARVYRETPTPKRAPPREKDTIQGASSDSPRVDKKAAAPDGATWEEHVAQVSRFLQASQRAETCVWRRGDDVQA